MGAQSQKCKLSGVTRGEAQIPLSKIVSDNPQLPLFLFTHDPHFIESSYLLLLC